MTWQDISGSSVLIPRHPRAIIHFLGGAFVGTAPNITYRWLLEQLAQEGYAIITTPFMNTLDHIAIAENVLDLFEEIILDLQGKNLLKSRYLPIYGMGHSMGCKLHLLIGSLFNVERAGNILISFNNYPIKQSIPFFDLLELDKALNLEFTPSPVETTELISHKYSITRNLLIRFENDTIDQTTRLNPVLKARFPNMTTYLKLPGNHLTPLSQDFNWEVREEFTPFDAIGQWIKQNLSRDLNHLKQEICHWLNPGYPR